MKNKSKLIIILSLIFVLTGCWDKVELENRGFAISVGVDKLNEMTEPKSMYPNRYQITLALPKLSSFAANDSASSDEARLIKKNVAPTVPGGMITANENISERLDYSHIKLIIFGADLLKDKLLFKEALDGIERVNNINRQVLIMATGSKAEQIFTAKSGNRPLVGFFVSDFYKNNSEKSATTFVESFEDLLKQLRDNGCAIVPRIEVKDEELALEGAALIKDYSIVGWLSTEQTSQYLFLNQTGMGIELLAPYNDILLKCRVLNQSADFKFSEFNNNLKLTINIDLVGEIEEYIFSDIELFNNTLLKEFETLFEQQLNQNIKSMLQQINEQYKTDFFHMEQKLSKKNYKLWQKYSQDWQQSYENMDIEIISNVRIKGLGTTK